MALLETIQLEHLPAGYTVHIALSRDIKNAAFLHQQLLTGNTSFEYALIDASIIVSKIHALAAIYRAINDLISNRLKSRNVHSEIVFSLSPNNNIAESFRRFGITPSTTNLLIIKVSTPSFPVTAADMKEHLQTEFEGTMVPFEDERLSGMTDLGKVRKVYKLNGVGGGGGKKGATNGVGREGEERRELEVLVLGAMALRGATN